MAITTNRQKYLGFHTTEEVFERLEDESHRRGMSRSLLIHRILVQAFALREERRTTEFKTTKEGL